MIIICLIKKNIPFTPKWLLKDIKRSFCLKYLIVLNVLWPTLPEKFYCLKYIIAWNTLLLQPYCLKYVIAWNALLPDIYFCLKYLFAWNTFWVVNLKMNYPVARMPSYTACVSDISQIHTSTMYNVYCTMYITDEQQG